MAAPRIHVLPDFLIDQIAAGEVVENAASVVKELVENAIDAGATRIVVEIGGGGLQSLRVTDDGCGMTPEEAELALRRHATSKLATADDLVAIRTLGFRGEALPSIASVSRFSLVTRTRDAEAATRVTVEDGRPRVEPAAAPPGTSITVRDLFHNVPARLKFQKGERSQVTAVADIVTRAALSHPEVHFTLLSGERRMADLPPCSRLGDRVAMVFGREAAGRLFEMGLADEGVTVSGVIGDPALARQDPSRVVLLVNGRPVLDLAIRRAVAQAYSVLLAPGTWPVAVVRLDVDPADVDVNVHPRKSEVRFRRHREVAGLVFRAVADAVGRSPWVAAGTTHAGIPGPAGDLPSSPSSAPSEGAGPRQSSPDSWNGPATPGLFDAAPSAADGSRFGNLRYVGQVAASVLVCETVDTVVFVDQHAAHERINYQRLWNDLTHARIASEPLLFPEIVRLEPREAARRDDACEALARLGFDLEPYSGDSLAVRAIPAILRGRAVAAVVRECVSAVSDEAETAGDARLRKVVATVACHASVRAGDVLTDPEARALLAAMDRTDLAGYCPHGRQAVVVYPIGTVLRWFGR